MLRGGLGTRRKPQNDALHGQVGVGVARGWIRKICVWDPSPGLGHRGWGCASEPSCASPAQVLFVFSAGAVISNPVSRFSPCCIQEPGKDA